MLSTSQTKGSMLRNQKAKILLCKKASINTSGCRFRRRIFFGNWREIKKSFKREKTNLGEGEEESNAAGAGKGHPDLSLDPLFAVKQCEANNERLLSASTPPRWTKQCS